MSVSVALTERLYTYTDERAGVDDLLELLDRGRPTFHADAACKEAPPGVSWFPRLGGDPAPAKRVCAGCLVRPDCLAWAVAQGPELAGIWGATSAGDRRKLRADG